jgi:hypothetical protein
MSNWIEKLFNTTVEEGPDPNVVEVYMPQNFGESEPPEPEVFTTEDLTAFHMVVDNVVVVQQRASTSWNARRFNVVANTPIQIANANPFRIRLKVYSGYIINVAFAPSREALVMAIDNTTLPQLFNAGGQQVLELNTTAEVWAVNVTAALDCTVVEEFVDG